MHINPNPTQAAQIEATKKKALLTERELERSEDAKRELRRQLDKGRSKESGLVVAEPVSYGNQESEEPEAGPVNHEEASVLATPFFNLLPSSLLN